MDNVKHTPGPWSIYFNSQDDLVIRKMFPDGQESHSIARCHSGFANARLIAAAPELLEASRLCVAELRAWMNCHGEDLQTISAMKASNAAISKATGGA